MSILCKLFGHQIPSGYAGGAPYLVIDGRPIDGMGTEHAHLYTTCPRCGTDYKIGFTHLPIRYKEEKRIAELEHELKDVRSKLDEYERLDLKGY